MKQRVGQPEVRTITNIGLRPALHLTPDEVERMIPAPRQTRYRIAERDAVMIMMVY